MKDQGDHDRLNREGKPVDQTPPEYFPFAELSQFVIDGESARLLGYDYCRQHHIVILNKVRPGTCDPVRLGMLNPGQIHIRREVSRFLQRPVEPVHLNHDEIEDALTKAFDRSEEETVGKRQALEGVPQFSLGEKVDIPDLVDELLGHALHLGASDIHIESYESDVDVRYRLGGVLYQKRTPVSTRNVRSVISRLKVLADMNIAERRRAQDGQVRTSFIDGTGKTRDVDFRLSIIPGPHGEDAVLRMLDSSKVLIGLESLGLDDEALSIFRELIENPEGLILVTGPTGSGKTTTLYAAIDHINRSDNKVLTVENPIEYSFPKVNQKQITPTMDFADYARSFLRQDPEIILVGEIRDEETADAAMRAAQTGHLVLSTLHTIDSTRTITRLRTLGIPPDLLASALIASLSQRLVKKLCTHCRRETAPTDDECRRLSLPSGEKAFLTAPGCDQCRGTGFSGRIGIFELFVPDENTADLIASETPIHKIRQRALAQGMQSLLAESMQKARKGLIPLSEVLRVIPYRMVAAERPKVT